MEPKEEKVQNTENEIKKEEKKEENTEEEFLERIKEEVEDGYIDDRGFYTTPNGSFWDENGNYFNHVGFDKHGGRYDKYGVYQPGKNYNYEYNCYEDEIDKNNNKFFDEINENTKKALEESFQHNNECVEAIDNINNDDNPDEEGDNYGLNEEEMEKIYNECIKIANKDDKDDKDNKDKKDENVIEEKKKECENNSEKDVVKVTNVTNILLLSKSKGDEKKNENIDDNTNMV